MGQNDVDTAIVRTSVGYKDRRPRASAYHVDGPIRRISVDNEKVAKATKSFRKDEKKIERLVKAGKIREAKAKLRRLSKSNRAMLVAANRTIKDLRFMPGERKPTPVELAERMKDPSWVNEAAYCKAKAKPDGSYRKVTARGPVDTARARLLEMTTLRICQFHHSQYGVRGKGLPAAVRKASELIRGGAYRYAIELDVTNCFGSVRADAVGRKLGLPEATIEEVITNRGKEKRNQLHPWNRQTRSIWNDIRTNRTNPYELPQGAPASSPLAFSLFKEPLEEFELRFTSNVVVVVYCDNILVLAKDRSMMRSGLKSLAELFRAVPEADFVLHEKSAIRRLSDGIDFLGYRLRNQEGRPPIAVTPAKLRAFKSTLRRKVREIEQGRPNVVCDKDFRIHDATEWCRARLPQFRVAPVDHLALMSLAVRLFSPYSTHQTVRQLFRRIERHAPNVTSVAAQPRCRRRHTYGLSNTMIGSRRAVPKLDQATIYAAREHTARVVLRFKLNPHHQMRGLNI
ncbi:MAG: reverse transcriptase domain-containing protein [Rhizobiaceae bacterium]